MNKLENGVIRYQIDFEKYKNGQANEIISLLDEANRKIAKSIKQTNGVYTKKRYQEISSRVKDLASELKDKVNDHTDIDGLIEYELSKQKILLNTAIPYLKKNVSFTYPSLEQIRTAALFKPVTENLTYDSYLNGIESGLFNVWDSAVRTGYLTGQTTQEIVRNVLGSPSKVGQLTSPGTINGFRNSIYGNTRTLLQSFANETQRRVYEENDELFGDKAPDGETYKYEYLATLDSRTCLVCGSFGGKLFKELKDVPNIPQHRGCRCVMLPYFNIEGEKIASKDGYTENVTFDKWLKEQNVKTQKEVLGETRYEKYNNGIENEVKGFVDNGKTMTLSQLEEKERVDIINSISRECSWYKNVPTELINDFNSDLKTVNSEHLMTILTHTKNVAADFNYNDSFFRSGENKIYMNLAQANTVSVAQKYKTNFSTFLHESGHAIDFNKVDGNGWSSYRIKGFHASLRKDLLNHCNHVASTKYTTFMDLSKDDSAMRLCLMELKLNPDMKNGVLDIYDALTDGQLFYRYRHGKSYWYQQGGTIKDELIQIEAFAHFSEAKGVGGMKLKILEDYFKESYNLFRESL